MQSFKEWKIIFDREVHRRKMRGEEEKLKAMTTKEREEHKKMGGRLTGGRVERFFGCRCQSSVLQDVNFSSATRTLLRPMLLYWKMESCPSI
jgi:hypothetical protein